MDIRTDVDYLSESISLLIFMGRNVSYEEYIVETVRKSAYDYKALLDVKKDEIKCLSQIQKEFKEEFKTDWKEFEYYFKPVTETGYRDCIGRILLLWEEFNHSKLISIEDYTENMLNMSREEFTIKFAETLQGLGNSLRDSTQFTKLKTDDDILRFIISLNISKEDCLKLEDCYLNCKTHLNKILGYIQRTSQILLRHHKELSKIMCDTQDYWDNKIGDEDFIEHFAKESKAIADMPHNPLGYVIALDIFSPFITGISFNMDDDTGEYLAPLAISIGILYCDEYPLSYNETAPPHLWDTEYYLNALKLISEKNRFAILSNIKKEPSFGNEIAGRLGLTTATVSHHMNQLVDSDLVYYKQNGTRFYYYSNQDNLKKCFEFIRAELNLN